MIGIPVWMKISVYRVMEHWIYFIPILFPFLYLMHTFKDAILTYESYTQLDWLYVVYKTFFFGQLIAHGAVEMAWKNIKQFRNLIAIDIVFWIWHYIEISVLQGELVNFTCRGIILFAYVTTRLFCNFNAWMYELAMNEIVDNNHGIVLRMNPRRIRAPGG